MHERFISSSTKMHYSSPLLLITMFSLLIIISSTTIMASSYDNYYYPPYNYYNYPPFSFQTPPPPPSSSPGDNYGAPPPMVDYTPPPPPPSSYNEASPPPPPHHKNHRAPDNNYYGSPPSPSPPNGNNDDDKTQFLKEHNEARHNITTTPKLPPLVWSETLAAYALNYANQRKDCGMVHSKGSYGENIASGSGGFSAKDAVDFWVTEKNNYDYSSNTCPRGDQVCGHYTQVIWRNTTRLGCARVGCGNSEFFVICSYDPPGNYDGQKPY